MSSLYTRNRISTWKTTAECKGFIKLDVAFTSFDKGIVPVPLIFLFCQPKVVFAMSFGAGIGVSGRPIWFTLIGVVEPM